MTKVELFKFKIYIPAAGAAPGPPLSQVLGQYSIAPAIFISQYNDFTEPMIDFFEACNFFDVDDLQDSLNLVVFFKVFTDKSYEFLINLPPTPILLKIFSIPLKLNASNNLKKNLRILRFLTSRDLVKLAMLVYPQKNLVISSNILKSTAKAMKIKIVK